MDKDVKVKTAGTTVLFICDQQGLPCSKEHNRYCGELCTHTTKFDHAKNKDIFLKNPSIFLSENCEFEYYQESERVLYEEFEK